MVSKCKTCGRNLVPYVIDPDVVEDYCPTCDDIPRAAEVSAIHCFMNLVTVKDETLKDLRSLTTVQTRHLFLLLAEHFEETPSLDKNDFVQMITVSKKRNG